MNNALVLDNTTIKTDSNGLFCLNDLHKAAGGDPKHQPAKFFANQSTRDLVQELRNSPNLETFLETHTGRNGGTYVCKELVYAYAMWLAHAVVTLTRIREWFNEQKTTETLPEVLPCGW